MQRCRAVLVGLLVFCCAHVSQSIAATLRVGFGASKPPYVYEHESRGLEYDLVAAALTEHGLGASDIHRELFLNPDSASRLDADRPPPAATPDGAQVTVILDQRLDHRVAIEGRRGQVGRDHRL